MSRTGPCTPSTRPQTIFTFAPPSVETWGISLRFTSRYRGSIILLEAGRLAQSWNPPMRPWASPLGISWWMMPLPAVIHCTSPGVMSPRFPMLSPCSTSPSRTYVIVSIPRCGCQGNPGRYFEGSSERKSSRSRKGSRRGASWLPKARLRWTPAPSIVGLARHTFRIALVTVMVAPPRGQAPAVAVRCGDRPCIGVAFPSGNIGRKGRQGQPRRREHGERCVVIRAGLWEIDPDEPGIAVPALRPRGDLRVRDVRGVQGDPEEPRPPRHTDPRVRDRYGRRHPPGRPPASHPGFLHDEPVRPVLPPGMPGGGRVALRREGEEVPGRGPGVPPSGCPRAGRLRRD